MIPAEKFSLWFSPAVRSKHGVELQEANSTSELRGGIQCQAQGHFSRSETCWHEWVSPCVLRLKGSTAAFPWDESKINDIDLFVIRNLFIYYSEQNRDPVPLWTRILRWLRYCETHTADQLQRHTYLNLSIYWYEHMLILAEPDLLFHFGCMVLFY